MNTQNYILQFEKSGNLKTQARRKNQQEFMNEWTQSLISTINLFKWNGLPDTCDPRMLELSAILNGTAMIAKDPENGALYSLISTPDGSLTLYGYPAGAYGTGLNGYNKHFSLYVKGGENIPILNDGKGTADAVLLLDNYLLYPIANFLSLYAERIADATRSIDVITRMLKSPAIIKGDEAAIASIKKVLEDVNVNIPYIVGIKDSPFTEPQSIDTGASPEALKALMEYVADLRSQRDTLLGINSNPDSTKRERMLVDEVNANNDATAYGIENRLARRQEFAEECNELFGTSITVEINPALAKNTEKVYNKEEGERNNDDNDTGTQNNPGQNAQQGKSRK